MIVGGDRSRLGLLVALCSLAGVVVGFGLSNMATMRLQTCPSMVSSDTQAVTADAIETPTWLGVQMVSARESGARVLAVTPRSPADRAGIRAGDVIVSAGSASCVNRLRDVDVASDLVRIVRQHAPGDDIGVRLLRGEDELVMRAELGKMPLALFLEELR
ncbi:PDZ domain-containing protein [Haliangium ochraceum]|nr:PDZ domain-containing protein [Haliangium ochraceum]